MADKPRKRLRFLQLVSWCRSNAEHLPTEYDRQVMEMVWNECKVYRYSNVTAWQINRLIACYQAVNDCELAITFNFPT